MPRQVIKKDSLYGVILTQSELDLIIALLGKTHCSVGWMIFNQLYPNQDSQYHVNDDERKGTFTVGEDLDRFVEKYTEELEAIGEKYDVS